MRVCVGWGVWVCAGVGGVCIWCVGVWDVFGFVFVCCCWFFFYFSPKLKMKQSENLLFGHHFETVHFLLEYGCD